MASPDSVGEMLYSVWICLILHHGWLVHDPVWFRKEPLARMNLRVNACQNEDQLMTTAAGVASPGWQRSKLHMHKVERSSGWKLTL